MSVSDGGRTSSAAAVRKQPTGYDEAQQPAWYSAVLLARHVFISMSMVGGGLVGPMRHHGSLLLSSLQPSPRCIKIHRLQQITDGKCHFSSSQIANHLNDSTPRVSFVCPDDLHLSDETSANNITLSPANAEQIYGNSSSKKSRRISGKC